MPRRKGRQKGMWESSREERETAEQHLRKDHLETCKGPGAEIHLPGECVWYRGREAGVE